MASSSSSDADAGAGAAEEPWSYRSQLLLAPMVRVNSLAFRTLALEHGCPMAYSEELVDRSLLACTRSEDEASGTVDYKNPDGRVIFKTLQGRRGVFFTLERRMWYVAWHMLRSCGVYGAHLCLARALPAGAERVVLQLGTAESGNALRAAQHVGPDVRAIDVNMGCPVQFSTSGGMGSALLTKPETVRDILSTLVRNLPSSLPVTCKIRLLEEPHATLQLARIIESCGVAAMAVHARRKQDRPRHWAQWDMFRLLRDSMPRSLPIILNGDVHCPADIPRAYELTGADSLMIARGAIWNPSIFECGRGAPMVPQAQVVKRYIDLAEQTDLQMGNAKCAPPLASPWMQAGAPHARSGGRGEAPARQLQPVCVQESGDAHARGRWQDARLQDVPGRQDARRPPRSRRRVCGAPALHRRTGQGADDPRAGGRPAGGSQPRYQLVAHRLAGLDADEGTPGHYGAKGGGPRACAASKADDRPGGGGKRVGSTVLRETALKGGGPDTHATRALKTKYEKLVSSLATEPKTQT